MTFSRVNPTGWNYKELLTHPQANQLDINVSRAVDGYAGGSYSPSAGLTWNNQIVADARTATGAAVTGVIGYGKGVSSIDGSGGIFYGGASTSAGGYGIYAKGGEPSSSGDGGKGAWLVGGDAASTGDGGSGITATGGDGAGTGHGGAGIFARGGTARGVGGYFLGRGGNVNTTYAGQGAIIRGGLLAADALWVITDTGSEPASPNSDYAIWANTGGAFPAAAVYGRADAGYGIIGITYTGIGIACTGASTGCPFRMVPGGEPTTNVYEGCFYFNSSTHRPMFYDGSQWREIDSSVPM